MITGHFFWLQFQQSRITWGDVVSGGGSVDLWAYFQVAVTPEPSPAVLMAPAILVATAIRSKGR